MGLRRFSRAGVVVPDAVASGRALANTSTKQLRALYYYSVAIQQLSLLWLFSACCVGTLLLPLSISLVPVQSAPSEAAMAAFISLGLVGLGGFIRAGWCRLLGLFLSVLLLAAFPVGTVLGLIGIVCYARGRRLFGRNRVSHALLKREYEHRQATRYTSGADEFNTEVV